MTRYKHYDRTQCRMVAVDSDRQILPGSFASVLDRLIDRRFRLSGLDARTNPALQHLTHVLCLRSFCMPIRVACIPRGRLRRRAAQK